MTQARTLLLPFPPSVGNYWVSRVVGKRVFMCIGKRGTAFRKEVRDTCRDPFLPYMSGRLHVQIEVYPPDRRKRDLDNLFKSTLDALQHAGVFKDDSQIDRLEIRRGEVRKGGECLVQIEQLEPTP